LYSSSAEEGSFKIRRNDKAARRRKKQKKKKKKKGITGKFFIIETSLSLAAYSFSTVFAYLLSSFLDQQMACVCVLSPDISSLPTCSMEVFHKN
jgi:phage portal protein BeeE